MSNIKLLNVSLILALLLSLLPWGVAGADRGRAYGVMDVGAPVAAPQPVASQTSPEGLLNPDGTLRLDGTFSGALNLEGWQAQMDPQHGPVLASATEPEWYALGSRVDGAIYDTVYTIVISGTDMYVGGGFEDVADNPEADYVAKWDGSTWSALGSNGAGDGAIESTVGALAVNGTDVYVGGYFRDVNNNGTALPEADYVAKWDGSDWSALGSNGAGDGAIGGDGAGGESDPSTPVVITVDTVPPATVPVITAPISGTWHNTATPIVTGTLTVSGTDAVDVVVTEDQYFQTCTATLQLDDTWSCTSPHLTNGRHSWTAVARDAAGNEGAVSDPVTVWIDTVAPSPPIITAPASGTTTNQYPTFEGTVTDAHFGSVTVYDDADNVICTGAVNMSVYPYTWACTAATALPAGEETFTAIATDQAGNVSGPSDSVLVNIVPVNLTPPVITAPVSGTLTNDPTPVFSGTVGGATVVTVTVSPSGPVVCTATVQADNTWTCTPDSDLGEAEHTIIAIGGDGTGLESDPSDPVVITIDITPPATKPLITAPISGTWHNAATPIVTGTLTVSGTDAVDVVVTEDQYFQTCTATLQLDDTWSCTSPHLTNGRHSWTAVARDAAGNEGAVSDPVTVWIDTVAPSPPIITAPVSGTTTSQYPTFEGTVTDAHFGSVTVYDDADNVICTGAVNMSVYPYTWACTAATALPAGEETFTAIATDQAGNVSGPSDPVLVNIVPSDNTAPVAVDDAFKVPESVPAQPSSVLDVLANDSDPDDGDTITITQVTAPSHGTATTNGATIIYTPTADYLGTDNLTYTITDGEFQATAQVTLTVLPVADLEVTQDIRATLSGYRIIIVVRNLGARDVIAPGAVLSDTFPAALGAVEWRCAAAGGAVCPRGGLPGTTIIMGNLHERLTTFPANSVLTYTITADQETDEPVSNVVTITEPATMFDWDQSNNRAALMTGHRIILPFILKNYQF